MTETSNRSPEADGDHAAPASGGGAGGSNAPELSIQCVGGNCPVDRTWLRDRLGTALEMTAASAGVRVQRLALSIVDDRRMSELHGRHMGKSTTTDVLTFCTSAGDGSIEADIAICADEAARHAAERGHSIERELLLYAIHGLLHCVGFDDHDEIEFERMHGEEDRILEAIGVGATFREPPR